MIPKPLPSRGIFVPTYLIFHTDLPPAPLRTWMQLRCLAWTGWSTPPMSLPEIAAQLGIHTTRLSKHLAQLKDISTLSWHSAGNEKITISFPEEYPGLQADQGETQAQAIPESPKDEHVLSPNPASYFPARILGYLSYEDDEPEYPADEDLFLVQSYPQPVAGWEKP